MDKVVRQLCMTICHIKLFEVQTMRDDRYAQSVAGARRKGSKQALLGLRDV